MAGFSRGVLETLLFLSGGGGGWLRGQGMAFDSGSQNSRAQQQLLTTAAPLLAGQHTSTQGKTLLLNAATSRTKDDDQLPGA